MKTSHTSWYDKTLSFAKQQPLPKNPDTAEKLQARLIAIVQNADAERQRLCEAVLDISLNPEAYRNLGPKPAEIPPHMRAFAAMGDEEYEKARTIVSYPILPQRLPAKTVRPIEKQTPTQFLSQMLDWLAHPKQDQLDTLNQRLAERGYGDKQNPLLTNHALYFFLQDPDALERLKAMADPKHKSHQGEVGASHMLRLRSGHLDQMIDALETLQASKPFEEFKNTVEKYAQPEEKNINRRLWRSELFNHPHQAQADLFFYQLHMGEFYALAARQHQAELTEKLEKLEIPVASKFAGLKENKKHPRLRYKGDDQHGIS